MTYGAGMGTLCQDLEKRLFSHLNGMQILIGKLRVGQARMRVHESWQSRDPALG
jgi:hypothetical protein